MAARTFGPMLPSGNWPSGEVTLGLGDVDAAQPALGVRSEVHHHRIDTGDEHEGIGVNLVGELGRCVVLVDDRIDAVPEVASTGDRDPPTAIGHHDMSGVQQTPHCLDLYEPAGLGEGTTRRYPRPLSSTMSHPRVSANRVASLWEKNGPIGLVGWLNAGSLRSTMTWLRMPTM